MLIVVILIVVQPISARVNGSPSVIKIRNLRVTSLYPHQRKCVDFHLKARYSLNFSHMGTGKSAIALIAAKESGEKLLVFGPAFLESNWAHEGETWGVDVKYISYGKIHHIQPEEVRGYGFWVAEECHYLKSKDARRTNVFHYLLETVVPPYFLGLTGTPIKNRIPDAWPLLTFCDLCPTPTNGKKMNLGYYQFAKRFCHEEQMRIYDRIVTKYIGIKNVPELKSILRGKYVKYLLEDVIDDLPKEIRKHVTLNLKETKETRKLREAYESGSKSDIVAKTASAYLKAKGTAEYVTDLLDQVGGSVIVFTDHVKAAVRLRQILKGVIITGAVSARDRGDIVKRFQAGSIEVLVATIGALSVGVTLTATNHIVFNDLSWSPGENLQAAGRIRRIGQKKTCMYHYIHSTPTDEGINRMLVDKESTMEKFV